MRKLKLLARLARPPVALRKVLSVIICHFASYVIIYHHYLLSGEDNGQPFDKGCNYRRLRCWENEPTQPGVFRQFTYKVANCPLTDMLVSDWQVFCRIPRDNRYRLHRKDITALQEAGWTGCPSNMGASVPPVFDRRSWISCHRTPQVKNVFPVSLPHFIGVQMPCC